MDKHENGGPVFSPDAGETAGEGAPTDGDDQADANGRFLIEKNLYIRKKDGRVTPLVFNKAQLGLYTAILERLRQGKPVRVIILKARQMGFSTAVEALFFCRAALFAGVRSLIIAHKSDATANLFAMSRLFYEMLPDAVRPMLRASNARELIFENPTKNAEEKKRSPGLRSLIKCATAGGDGVARSDTFQNLHISEYAHWPSDKARTLTGILQTVPDAPGSMVIIESTANGFEDFKERWDAAVNGESDYIPLFFPWFACEDYREPDDPDFTPTMEEKSLAEAHGLSAGQLIWRRTCIRNKCAGDVKLFHQEYPSTPQEAFLHSGRPVFDPAAVMKRLAEEQNKTYRQGRFTLVSEYDKQDRSAAVALDNALYRFEEAARGEITLYQPPERGVPYVIGADTAGEGSDYFAAQVLDNTTGRQAAVLHHREDEDFFIAQLFCLGRMYNDALIGVEVNFSTFPVKRLDMLGYPRQYMREIEDTITKRVDMRHGFKTTALTRPLIISGLASAFRGDSGIIRDRRTLEEMLGFVYNAAGRPEARRGSHDDLIMALAIAFYIRGQQSYKRAAKASKCGKMIERMKRKGADPSL